jgi:hypothetical protein
MAGRPVRPGQAPDGAVLLPLEKSRAGDDAPVFPVEVFYLIRDGKWTEKGRARLTLPALDLPISRSGVVLYHSPQFKLTSEPGTFRTEPYENPFSAALNPSVEHDRFVEEFWQRRDGAGQNANDKALDDFRTKTMGGKSVRVLPVRMSFPEFGTSLFLVAELTGEGQSPAIDLNYQRDKKEGGK